MTAHNDLAERIERADGPDRALDAEIHTLLNPGDRWVIGHEPGRFPQAPIYGSLTDAINSFADRSEAGDFINAPKFTGSLDAAMQLVHPATVEFEARHLLNEAINRCFRSGLPLRDNLARYIAATALRAQVQP